MMFKYFNCFFSSFFRTLGRIIVYILLGVLFSILLSKIDVHADMVSPNEISFNGTKYDSYYEIPVILDNHSIDLRVEIFDMISRVPTLQTNLILDVCATTNQFNIWRTSAAGGSCSTSCFSQLVQVKQIPDLVCRTYTYNDNRAYRIVIPINKWSIGSGSSDYITFDDKITIHNSSVHDLYASIYGAYYSDIGFDLNNQDALFNDLNQTQKNILNKQNEINNNINDLKNGVGDINSSINDSSSPDLDALKNTAGWLPAGPIDSILNLPLTLLNSLTTNLSKSCIPVELPLPYIDKNLTLPCLNTIYSQIEGLSVWVNSIGVIASAFILFQYLMNLYKWVDDTLSFRENNFIDNWTGV